MFKNWKFIIEGTLVLEAKDFYLVQNSVRFLGDIGFKWQGTLIEGLLEFLNLNPLNLLFVKSHKTPYSVSAFLKQTLRRFKDNCPFLLRKILFKQCRKYFHGYFSIIVKI